MQAASPPNQTSFVASGLSENTRVYTAGVILGYRISSQYYSNKAMPALRLGQDHPSLCSYAGRGVAYPPVAECEFAAW